MQILHDLVDAGRQEKEGRIRDRVLEKGLPRWLSGKELTCNAGEAGPIPGLGRSPGVGNSNPFQYSCLGKHMVRGVRQVAVHGVIKSR